MSWLSGGKFRTGVELLNDYEKKTTPFNIITYMLAISMLAVVAYYRTPWIDESWFSGPAVSFIRYGQILDLGSCMWTLKVKHAFGFELYALFLSVVYKLFSVDVFVGRALTIAAAILTLAYLRRALLELEFEARVVSLSIICILFNYFFIYASTQIRPDMFSFCFAAVSFYYYLIHLRGTGNAKAIMLAHLFIVIAIFLHPQAAFTMAALWIAMFVVEPLRRLRENFVYILMPYAITGTIYFVYIINDIGEFVALQTKNYGGSMLGHKGGIFTAISTYYINGEALKLAAVMIIVLPLVASLSAIYRRRGSGAIRVKRIAALCFGLGGFASWLATTTHVDDYHAIWLGIAFALAYSFSFSVILNKRFGDVLGGVCLLSFAPVLVGLGYASSVIVTDGRHVSYNKDLSAISTIMDDGGSNYTYTGPRDVQLYYGYKEEKMCSKFHGMRPNYRIDYHADHMSELDEGYKILYIGSLFDLYGRFPE